MGEPRRVEQIIAQAPQWSLEGDCTLLSWMKEISENLEQRASATNQALQQLSVNVNRTAIALDNTANSLTALQYTQFVESRCHDDDETIANATEVPVSAINVQEQTKAPNEILKTFLSRNLEMLHKCHEKYAIDLDDSDDEEAAAQNCIYQPKNPYNDKLLPHICGSKLWKENWHVGLCDGDNEYSGNETSEAFSESSSSAEDNESYESNTANLSEWTSSNSIANDQKLPTQGNIVSYPEAQRKPQLPVLSAYTANSETSSTTSRSISDNRRTSQEQDLFAPTQDSTTTTTHSSSASTQESGEVPQAAARVVSSNRHTIVPPFYNATPPPDDDIFAEAPSVKANEQNSMKMPTNQIKRRPVNLFEDDDFNSFMTEITEKAETIAEKNTPVPAARTVLTKPEKSKEPTVPVLVQSTENVNNAAVMPTKTPVKAAPVPAAPKFIAKQPINLFESPTVSPDTEEPLFARPSAAKSEEKKSQLNETKTRITPKSLFDEDDDDDDFLSVFSAKKVNVPKPLGRTLLFDEKEEEENVKGPEEKKAKKVVNLFGDLEDEASVEKPQVIAKTLEPTDRPRGNPSATVKAANEIGLFAETVKPAETAVSKPSNLSSTKLFDYDDEDENLFSKKPSIAVKKVTEPTSKAVLIDEEKKREKENQIFSKNPAPITTSKSLFGEEEDEDEDDLFGIKKGSEKGNRKLSIEKKNTEAENTLFSTKKTIEPVSKPLFFDDSDQMEEDNEIFISQKESKATNKPLFPEENKDVLPLQSKEEDQQTKSRSISIQNVNEAADKGMLSEKKDKQKDEDELFAPKRIVEAESSTTLLAEDRELTRESDIRESDQLSSERMSPKVNNQSSENVVEAADKKLRSNEEDENNLLAPKDVTVSPIKPQISKDKPTVEPLTNKPLFVKEDNDDGDLFEKPPNLVTPVRALSKEVVPKKLTSTSLFDEENDADNDDFLSQLASKPIVKNATAIVSQPPVSLSTQIEEEDKTPQSSLAVESQTVASTAENPSEKVSSNLTSEEIPSKDTFTNAATLEEEPSLEVSNDVPPPDQNLSMSFGNEANLGTHNYAGIFLDEPPDDDDFFQTLGSSQYSTSKLTLDIEHDFYEPALPAPPTNAPKETTKLDQSINSSDYGGLQLFSEIPPDDDGQSVDIASRKEEDIAPTIPNQRLHSVFYDDFNETIEAIQSINEPKKSTFSLFNNEPPPDEDDDFDIMTKIAKEKKPEKSLEEPKATPTVVPEKPPSPQKTPKIPSKIVETKPSEMEKPKPATGKLQMPNISINVQALLPGGGARPKFKKSEEPIGDEVDRSAPPLSGEISKAPVSNESGDNGNENMLSSVCKNRVRAPAKRRPSTRRARQESYRNSMLAEQAADGEIGQGDGMKNDKQSNETIEPKEQIDVSKGAKAQEIKTIQPTKLFNDVEDNEAFFEPQKPKNVSTPSAKPFTQKEDESKKVTAALFDDSNENTDDLFESISAFKKPIQQRTAPLASEKPKQEATTSVKPLTTTLPPSTKPSASSGKSIFNDEPSDSDEDLFQSRSTKAPLKSDSAAVKKVQNVSKKVDSLFGSEDEDDDEFLKNLKKTEETKAKKNAAKRGAGEELFSDVDSDEEDLFSGTSKARTGTTKSTAMPKILNDPLALPKPSSAPTTAKPSSNVTVLADNPLADLLND